MRSCPFPHKQFAVMDSILQNTLKKLLSERISLDMSLMTRLPKSILQEAIQGKLVPQFSDDEPASFLLERIKQEKHKMLTEGKLKKKDIIDSMIFKGDDNKYYETIAGHDIEIEVPFLFPDSWAIVRLQFICALLDGEKMTGDGICDSSGLNVPPVALSNVPGVSL